MRFSRRRPGPWLMLAIGMYGQLAGTLVVSTPPFLIPHLHLSEGVSLVGAGAIASAAAVGTMVSLVPWGAIVDRYGERRAMIGGLAVVTVGALGAATTTSLAALAAWFFVCGAGVGSTNAASGRLVVGWFPAHRRGLAMGIRQTALPLGVGTAALLVPNLIEATTLATTILTVAGVALAATIAAFRIVDPPRPPRPAAGAEARASNPYRQDTMLVRLHLASALLVVPQYTIWTFFLLWLVDTRAWSIGAGSLLVAATHVLSAGGRIGVGWWSDRVGSRLGPMRWVAAAAAIIMAALGLLASSSIAVALAVAATVVTVSDNGLAFTAVAERAGSFWSGRAFGIQNTGQYLTAAAVPPAVGGIVTHQGYGWAFGSTALLAALAIALVPRERGPGGPRT